MADQHDDIEQDLLPDSDEDGVSGESDRDFDVDDMSGMGIGDERLRSGHKPAGEEPLPDEGFEGV
jgi:hypothetical protein